MTTTRTGNRQGWLELLTRVTAHWLDVAGPDDDELVPSELADRQWLGTEGASEATLGELEARIGLPLPPSYRGFLETTDGWYRCSYLGGRLLRADETDWLRQIDPEMLRGWEEAAVMFGSKLEENERSPLNLPDEHYFVYDQTQDPLDFRAEYLSDLIQISATAEVTYLLNPAIRTEDGEWEAWALSPSYPGAHRFPSFRELFESEFGNDYVLFPEKYEEVATARAGLPHPAAFAHGSQMWTGQHLRRQSLTSSSGVFTLLHQHDGDLVLYRHSDGYQLWSAGTAGRSPGYLQLRDDGNLVLVDGEHTIVWKSGTAGQAIDQLVVDDSGAFALLDSAGTVLWSSDQDDRAG